MGIQVIRWAAGSVRLLASFFHAHTPSGFYAFGMSPTPFGTEAIKVDNLVRIQGYLHHYPVKVPILGTGQGNFERNGIIFNSYCLCDN